MWLSEFIRKLNLRFNTTRHSDDKIILCVILPDGSTINYKVKKSDLLYTSQGYNLVMWVDDKA